MTSVQRQVAALFDQHAPLVFRVLRRFGVRDADVEDVTQEVFLVALRLLERGEGPVAERAWLYAISRRCASTHRRRAHHRREVLVEREQAEHESLHLEVMDALLCKRLEMLLQTMPEVQREVYTLFEIEELPMREVAALLDVPVKTAYSRLYAAREIVRHHFAEKGAVSREYVA